MNQIQELRRQGLRISEIAAITGHDRKTIRKYLKKPWREPKAAKRRRRRSKLDPFRSYIEERLHAGVSPGPTFPALSCPSGASARWVGRRHP